MPTWSETLKELNEQCLPGSEALNAKVSPIDFIRRKYLKKCFEYTKRNIILYSSCWIVKPNVPPNLSSITDEDLQGLMEVIHGLSGSDLDLILHTPGGSIESTEAFVSYLRSKFKNIRVIVPSMAMSAGTMISCAGDVIVLGKHSFLGPTDPQLVLPTPTGGRWVSAQSILDQFDLAQKECKDSSKLNSWLPMLSQYGPDLLIQSDKVIKLSQELVESWLEKYMLKNEKEKAKSIAEWLSDNNTFKTHGRKISRDQLEKQGLKIQYLEENQKEQDLFLSIFHTINHTFTSTFVTKIIENHTGRAFMKFFQPQPVVMPNQSQNK